MRCIESKESSQKNMQGPTIFTVSLRSYGASKKKNLNPKINIKQQTQKNYFKPANLQSRNKHIERSSNKSTEMNNSEPISSSLFSHRQTQNL